MTEAWIIRTGHHGQTFGGDLLNHAGAGLHPLQPAQVIGHEVERVDLGTIEGVAFGDLLRARGAGRVILAVVAQMRRAIHQTIERDVAALRHRIVVEIMRAGDLDRA